MKRILCATAAILGLGMSSAIAQDQMNSANSQPFNWSGFYIGGHGGGVFDDALSIGPDSCNAITNILGENGQPDYADTVCDADSGVAYSPYLDEDLSYFDLDGDYVAERDYSEDKSSRGWLGGGQVGVNHQYGRLVLGLEGDVSRVKGLHDDIDASFRYFHTIDDNELVNWQGDGFVSSTNKLDYITTLRGRIGGAFGSEGRFLAYLTGGVAVAHISSSLEGDFGNWGVDWCQGDCYFDGKVHNDFYQVGGVVGVGGEFAIPNSNLTVGLEGLYVALSGGETNSLTFHADDGRAFDVNQKAGFDNVTIVRGKVNLLFN